MLDEVFDYASQALVILENGTTVWRANHAATRLTGCEVGRPFADFVEADGFLLALTDARRVSNWVPFRASTQHRGGVRLDAKVRKLRKDDGLDLCLVEMSDESQSRGAFLKLREDVSRMEASRERLEAMHRRLSNVIEATGAATWELDLGSGEYWVNDQWLKLLGLRRAEFEHSIRQWEMRVHPEDLPQVLTARAAHLAGETPSYAVEARVRTSDGSWLWIADRGRVVARDAEGKPLTFAGIHLDVTPSKDYEAMLEQRREEAESANRAKSAFLANVSHEIRTPLNGVIGLASALDRSDLTPRQREMVSLIKTSGETLEGLLTDILDLSKIEAGRFDLVCDSFDLRQAVEAASAVLKVRADDKGVGFTVSFGPGTEGLFEGDVIRVRQIVSNLTSNAVKFTERGRVAVSVTVEDRAVGPSLVRLVVEDTGIGFDELTAARLFGRFEQADSSTTRRFGGTGLGLSISKALVDRMGGTIRATSVLGQGSRFEVTLPLPRAGKSGSENWVPSASILSGSSGGSETALRVLLAEDHPINQRVISLMLEPFDVALTVAGDGEQALAAFQAGRFDLVLMDMQMPVMDGLEATRRIRALEAAEGRPRTPVAMLSANAMKEHVDQAREAGCDTHIAKPVRPEALVAAMEALIHPHPDAKQAAVA